jgi:VWFA-related protein
MKFVWRNLLVLIFADLVCVSIASGQAFRRELNVAAGGTIEVVNRYGRVDVSTIPAEAERESTIAVLMVTAKNSIAENELGIVTTAGIVRIESKPSNKNNRVDISLTVPERIRLKVATLEGEVRVSGDLEVIEIKTETGTIAADVPTDDLNYEMMWTESRPRFLSDFELAKVKEKSAGRFLIKGHFPDESEDGDKEKRRKGEDEKGKRDDKSVPPAVADGATEGNGETLQTKDQRSKTIYLIFTTARGIVLLNVPPNEVMSDLRERPLTNAAKAIIRSGDTLLMDAIRRASPKYFGDYARTLPPSRREPSITTMITPSDARVSSVKIATTRVTDLQNRAISGLTKDDFEATESGEPREIIGVRPTTAPVNLVLLVDVSGSVDNYVNFIRKAARAFVDTVNPNDRISIVLFNEDVKVLSGFTTDKAKLSQTLDTFDAGGGTAYYDAIGYTLTETIRPMRGERTAIVVLSDGDDNRSFLPLDALIGTIEESGALIYPLYVPSSLIAAAVNDPNSAVDPLRSRYLSNDLTSKADGEGKRLAQASGGVYYPITQLSQIQTAYEDIVAQLRTAYDITFRSEMASTDGKPSPRLKIRTKTPNTFVHIRSVHTLQTRP